MLVFIGVYLFQFKTAHSKTHYQSSIKLLIFKAQKIKTLSRDPATWYICHLFLLFYIEMKGNVGGYVALPPPYKITGEEGVAPALPLPTSTSNCYFAANDCIDICIL